MQAVESVRRGERPAIVARVLGVARPSVHRWLRQAKDPQGLVAKPHPGPASRLSTLQLKELEALLLQGPKAHGWKNELWTTARVVQLIQHSFGVSFHHDHVGRFLRARLGWSPQKPRRKAREADDGEIARWQSDKFPRIVTDAQQRNAHLVFLDESGFMLTPTVRRTWAPRGSKPLLKCWDRRDRISAISGITVSPHRQRLNLHFELLPDNHNAKAPDIIDFLRKLKERVGAFTVIWDGSSIHKKSQLVRAFLAKHPEIVEETLPAYAPHINPDELVWGWTKYGRLSNLAATNTEWLRDHLVEEFSYLQDHRHLLGSFIHKTKLPLALSG